MKSQIKTPSNTGREHTVAVPDEPQIGIYETEFLYNRLVDEALAKPVTAKKSEAEAELAIQTSNAKREAFLSKLHKVGIDCDWSRDDMGLAELARLHSLSFFKAEIATPADYDRHGTVGQWPRTIPVEHLHPRLEKQLIGPGKRNLESLQGECLFAFSWSRDSTARDKLLQTPRDISLRAGSPGMHWTPKNVVNFGVGYLVASGLLRAVEDQLISDFERQPLVRAVINWAGAWPGLDKGPRILRNKESVPLYALEVEAKEIQAKVKLHDGLVNRAWRLLEVDPLESGSLKRILRAVNSGTKSDIPEIVALAKAFLPVSPEFAGFLGRLGVRAPTGLSGEWKNKFEMGRASLRSLKTVIEGIAENLECKTDNIRKLQSGLFNENPGKRNQRAVSMLEIHNSVSGNIKITRA